MKLARYFNSMFKITELGPIDIGRTDEFQLNLKYRARQIALHIETSQSTTFVVTVEFPALREL